MIVKRLTLMSAFVRAFARYGLHVGEVTASLLALIVLGGVTISYLEDIPFGDAVYFAFITGLSIGYGDITPETVMGRLISVVIGLIGMLFVGITVAIATRALADVAQEQNDRSGE
jgi:voltage-gated potassium channel